MILFALIKTMLIESDKRAQSHPVKEISVLNRRTESVKKSLS